MYSKTPISRFRGLFRKKSGEISAASCLWFSGPRCCMVWGCDWPGGTIVSLKWPNHCRIHLFCSAPTPGWAEGSQNYPGDVSTTDHLWLTFSPDPLLASDLKIKRKYKSPSPFLYATLPSIQQLIDIVQQNQFVALHRNQSCTGSNLAWVVRKSMVKIQLEMIITEFKI